MPTSKDHPSPAPITCSPADGDAYPRRLLDLPNPPLWLRVLGRLPRWGPPGTAVALVGTRAATHDALEFAFDLAADLAAAGALIVSGGARGIDAAAHAGALSVGGLTVAVLATGLRPAYPRDNHQLFDEIVATGGALVTEVPDGTVPHSGRFLERNRLVAALTERVVIIQAPERSGALSTAAWAKRLQRRVFCVPGAPWDRRFAGSNALLNAGASVCTSARDVLSVRPKNVAGDRDPGCESTTNTNDIQGLDDVCRAVWDRLANGERNPERIAAALDIRINRVHECLLSLELAGAAHRDRDGHYGLRANRTGQRPRYGSDQKEGFEEEGRDENGHDEGRHVD